MPINPRAQSPPHTFDTYGNEPLVIAYETSVDSTAMLIGPRDRKIKPRLILFANTGSEKPETIA
ncbi:MAG TPA: hypothetical protein VMU78_09945 [Methylocella sp.]|nr:hypothetical protein [Methylocella sp.]